MAISDVFLDTSQFSLKKTGDFCSFSVTHNAVGNLFIKMKSQDAKSIKNKPMWLECTQYQVLSYNGIKVCQVAIKGHVLQFTKKGCMWIETKDHRA